MFTTDDLRKAAVAVYLAAEESAAKDISEKLLWAAKRIEELGGPKMEPPTQEEWEQTEKFVRASLKEAEVNPARTERLIEYYKMTFFDPSQITMENMLKYWN